MPHDLPKAYDPAAIEEKWAEYWVKENLFAQPAPAPGEQVKDPFTILLPPPNVTGRLHMGHMLNQTEMDILVRWHRMKGDKTLWVPGTDHAGIATQMMVEKQLATEGTSRKELGREAFEARVWQWRDQYGKAILDQMKRLGASVDWSREYFTMDADLSVSVREAFARLYHQGLIYRGAYVVNWCPGCQTAVSDLEVVHEETLGKLWEIRYPVVDPLAGEGNGYLTIATTRPETLLGDVAVAIHPEDERYTHLHGKKLLLPLMNREIPIVLDTWVSRDFGTGAVKITPAHDPNDFALGQRHNLPSINIMDATAKINENGGVYAGLDRYVARKRVLEDLETLGVLGNIHDHKLSVGRCDRSKDVIEPRLSTQWFVAVNKNPEGRSDSIADLATRAVTEGQIRFTPEMYRKTYLNWMENIYDWCISRQLWWGHRIPAWHCAVCHKITVPKPGVASDPVTCVHCNSPEITQETDVLDTWFSSALLPISVFGWPFLNGETIPSRPEDLGRTENPGAPSFASFATGGIPQIPDIPPGGSPDFQTFYPTSLLVTGFDILFFWVARMIMLGVWFAQEVPLADGSQRTLAESVPFRDVYIHALVRDANKEKMSKTKGNVIDPIGIVQKYGTDAVRFTLASMASPGTDIAFNEARTEGYRAFANKIWNAARFLFMNVDRAAEIGIEPVLGRFSRSDYRTNLWPVEELWILSLLNKTVLAVNEALRKFRYDDAANLIYQFFWAEFCDWYIEFVKVRLDLTGRADKNEMTAVLSTGLHVFEASLRLLSPFMPFLTEELWSTLYSDTGRPHKSIALATYPEHILHEVNHNLALESGEQAMEVLKLAITALRTRRKELGVDDRHFVPATIASDNNSVLIKNKSLVETVAHIEHLEIVSYRAREEDAQCQGLLWQTFGSVDVSIQFEKPIDAPAERDRLTKEIAKLEKNLISAERQLSNEAFLAKAPANIVEGLKKQESENRLLFEKAKAALAALPPE